MLKYGEKLKKPSQQLRSRMTDAEKVIWFKTRRKQIKNLQFDRQKPIGSYIVDFFCPKAKLVIEIDGGQHYEAKGERQDKIRDEYLKKLGLKILRFQNTDVLKDIDGVVKVICDAIEKGFPPLEKGD